MVRPRLPPFGHQVQRIAEELCIFFGGGIGICDAALQNLQQRLDQDATMCVGGLERFPRLRVPILAEFDQHLFRRFCRDGGCNRLVSKAIDASPEGTLGTGPADRIVEALLVRRSVYASLALC
jgi:hypothetical protein